MFDKATLHLDGGRTLVISRTGEGLYVQKATLDGKPFDSSWLPVANLHSGVTQLDFTMGTEPNKQRGSALKDRPPSFR